MKPSNVLLVMILTALTGAVAVAATDVDPDKVARGKYLVTVAGCNDCHTPWKMGPERPRARHDAHAVGPSRRTWRCRRHRSCRRDHG